MAHFQLQVFLYTERTTLCSAVHQAAWSSSPKPFFISTFFFKLNLIRFKYRTKWCGLGCLTPIVLKPTGVWTSVFSSLSHNLSSDISSDHCHFNNIPEIAWWVTYSKQFNSSLSNSEPLPCTLLGIVKFYCYIFFLFFFLQCKELDDLGKMVAVLSLVGFFVQACKAFVCL